MPIPYIGITDFDSGERVRQVANYFATIRGDIPHRLMVGVMQSFKTLRGIPSSWSDCWPRKEELSGIFIDHPMVMNTLHYADYPDEGEYRGTNQRDIKQLLTYCGPYLHSIQFDMIWPSTAVVFSVKDSFPDVSVVLQISKKAIERCRGNPDLVLGQLDFYDDGIDYILLDPSMGRGQKMEPAELLRFAIPIHKEFPRLGIAVAGGLGPDTTDLLRPFLERFPVLSCDAQGKLRRTGDSHDPIDWGLALDYLKKTTSLFQTQS